MLVRKWRKKTTIIMRTGSTRNPNELQVKQDTLRQRSLRCNLLRMIEMAWIDAASAAPSTNEPSPASRGERVEGKFQK
jgi:hypothetical protein